MTRHVFFPLDASGSRGSRRQILLTGEWLLALVLIAFLIVPAAFGQETTAGLQGTVKDSTGGVITNATVELSSPALLGGARKGQTDEAGRFRISALPPGEYTLSITAAGFRTHKQVGIDLAVGRLPTLDVKMEVGAVAETIEVSGSSTMVDTTSSKVQVSVDKDILDNIPKGRSFESLIPFAPGARQEPLQGGYQIDGASDSENVYLIDGVNTTQIQNGGVGKSFQMDFIQEVQIKSSSFEAEYGGALGGVVNAVPKRGSNNWHGSLVTYLRNNNINANNSDRSLRTNPLLASLNTTTRLDATPEYFNGKKDQRNIVEPGFEVGGPIRSDRLWLYASYIPQIDTTRRTTNFIGTNPGPRSLSQTTTQQNAYNRLDYAPINNLRLYGSWNYGYYRTSGSLGGQDSNIVGQRNTGATTDPSTLRADSGSVNPYSVFSFGGDWTPTNKLVVSARWGYFFNNTGARGLPTGLRYLYNNTLNASSTDLAGAALPSSYYNTSGYANITSNLATSFDAYKRKSIDVNISYFVHAAGTHTFKTGYFYQSQNNDVLRTYNGGYVTINWGNNEYVPQTSTTICDSIKASNLATFGKSVCQGQYGYFIVGNGVVNTGGTSQTAHAWYLQDSWQVGKGLTLNLGLRLDKETQPPYDPTRFPTLAFGWGDKLAPRIGGAYDLLHNGKLKISASYGKFYDIMKMGLARGSFGSDYWHNCVYALDDPNYTKIVPTYPIGGGCPASGPAPGVTGRFIENVDYRATKADNRDPAISPDMKPMMQHEYVFGAEWAVNDQWSFETRFSRKILDRTIEDMAITDSLGFYIGNPGSSIADLMHRPTVIPGADGKEYLNNTPFCAECPSMVGAIRRYNGLEFRLSRRATGKWFGSLSYTYSKLTGNYAGLTNTDPTDGSGGRHAPNNNRAFDIPVMTYLPNGKTDDGPLSTDRPHTAKAYANYRLKWGKMETLLGVQQWAFQGTPINTCLPVVGTSSSCQWAEGRGNFVNLTRAANGDIVKGDVTKDARTDPYVQTDLSIHHQIPVSEGKRLDFEVNLSNLFNQRGTTSYYEFLIPTNTVSPTRASRFSGDPQVDWGKVMNGYNYIDAVNGAGAFAGVQSKLTLASRYGMANGFQTARNIRLALRFMF
jgi:hypothetical protein